jgi:hypothetical protein
MGQRQINEILGIIRGWNLTGMENDYGDKLAEDDKIRKYIHAHRFI